MCGVSCIKDRGSIPGRKEKAPTNLLAKTHFVSIAKQILPFFLGGDGAAGYLFGQFCDTNLEMRKTHSSFWLEPFNRPTILMKDGKAIQKSRKNNLNRKFSFPNHFRFSTCISEKAYLLSSFSLHHLPPLPRPSEQIGASTISRRQCSNLQTQIGPLHYFSSFRDRFAVIGVILRHLKLTSRCTEFLSPAADCEGQSRACIQLRIQLQCA